MLIIVNPYATTVSDRLKNLVVYALQAPLRGRGGRHRGLRARDRDRPRGPRRRLRHRRRLRRRRHPQRGRQRARGHRRPGFGAPGRLDQRRLPHARHPQRRRRRDRAPDRPRRRLPARARSTSGTVNGRRFVFACGVGLDATVVKRVDAHPRLKARARPVVLHLGRDLGLLPPVPAQPGAAASRGRRRALEGVTAIAQNSDPFTYFGNRPIRVCEDIGARRRHALGGGAPPRHPARHAADRGARPQRAPARARAPPDRRLRRRHRGDRVARSRKDEDGHPRPFPVQVDGDYIGEYTEIDCSVEPGALTVVA